MSPEALEIQRAIEAAENERNALVDQFFSEYGVDNQKHILDIKTGFFDPR